MAYQRTLLPANAIECDECGGSGLRLVYGDSSGWMYEKQTCEDCGGSGLFCCGTECDDDLEMEMA